MKNMKRTIMTAWLLVFAAALWAQAPNGSGDYYKNADGKKGAALKSALCTIIHNHTQLSYKSLNGHYATTDMRPDNFLWDIYSNITSYTVNSTTTGTEGRGYNKEHTVPQSWFNGASPMYSDIFHVLPTDSWVNSMRGNKPFGETSNPSGTSKNGFSKWGPCDAGIGYSGEVFEPNDEYKGDLARIYFYMVTCYESELRTSTWSGGMFTANGLSDWALRMLMRWSENDPVSQKEIDRNNAVYDIKVQGNRNPFVDYPGLEQYIWGDKTSEAFDYDNYSGAATETVAKPIFTPIAGTYIESVNVFITTTQNGATIYYTTDGSTPNASSTRYTSSFTLTETTTVNAIAILDGESSRVASATYTIKQNGEIENGIVWQEDWSGNDKDTPVQDVENATAVYSSGDDGTNTKIYNENLAGGNAPELLISKTGYFQATIALGGVSGNLILTFMSNRANLTVSSSTTGVSIGGGSYSEQKYTYTVYVPYGTQTLELKFENSSSKNARADDFLLVSEGGDEPGPIPVTLAFADDEVTATLGEDFTAPALIITPADADIEVVYESSNPTVAAVDAQTGEVTLLNEGVATIIASFEGNDTYMACDDATYTLTVNQSQQSGPGNNVFAKISTTSDLEDGKNYLLVYDADSKAYAGFDSNKGTIGDVTINNDQIDMNDAANEAQVLVLEKSGNYWLIKDGDYYLALTNDANTLARQNSSTKAGTKWDITFDNDGKANITNVEHNAYRLQYNTQGMFRCYKGSQQDPSLYKEIVSDDIEVTIGSTGYASLYYGTVNLTVPEGVEATTYSVNNGKLNVTKTYAAGEVIPAGTAVILYDGVASAQTYKFAKTSETGTAPEENMLRGSDENTTTTGEQEGTAYTYYMLAVDPDTQDPASVGFYYGADGGAAFTTMAHKAYLAVPSAAAQGAKAFTFFDLTAIGNIEADKSRAAGEVYSISGQRMRSQSLPKGIYVKDGKKVVVK